MKNSIAKVCFATIAMTLILMMSSTSSFATDVNKVASIVKYVGKMEAYPVFQVEIENASNNDIEITIRDAQYTVLHQESISGGKLSRLYRLDVEEDELKDIRFIISNKKTREEKVYTVTSNSIYISTIAVNNQ